MLGVVLSVIAFFAGGIDAPLPPPAHLPKADTIRRYDKGYCPNGASNYPICIPKLE